MPIGVIALSGIGLLCVAGFFKIRGKVTPAGRLVQLLEPIPDEGEFGRLCNELLALGFEPVGDFKRESALQSGNSLAVVRAFRSGERRMEAVVYRLTHIGAVAGSAVTVVDLVSRLGEERSLTTTTAPAGIFFANPDRPQFKHPFVKRAAALVTLHEAHLREAWSGQGEPQVPPLDGFGPRFDAIALRQLRYQVKRGLYREESAGIFVGTDLLALRGLANFFLRVGDPASWRSPLFFVVAATAGMAAFSLSGGNSLGRVAALAAAAVIGAGMPKGSLLWVALYVAALDSLHGRHNPALLSCFFGYGGFWLGVKLRRLSALRAAGADAALR